MGDRASELVDNKKIRTGEHSAGESEDESFSPSGISMGLH